MYLDGWKETLPVGEAHALPAGRKPFQLARMCLAGHLEGGYLRIPAKAGGYLPADADATFPGKSNRISGFKENIYVSPQRLRVYTLNNQ
jgi:hypothetical protein